MMPSSNQRSYSRFIPSEEVGDFTQWKFSAVDGSEPEPEPEPEPVAEALSVEIDEAAQQALLQQACDDAYAEGFAQGQAQTALEWQQRMDDYVAQQGQEAAQRLQSVMQSLDASLIDVMGFKLSTLDLGTTKIRLEVWEDDDDPVCPQVPAPQGNTLIGTSVADQSEACRPVIAPVTSTTGNTGIPALPYCSRYIHEIASTCGNCHTNMMRNSDQPPRSEIDPRLAAQPIIGGNAPGTAPTTAAKEVYRLSGV